MTARPVGISVALVWLLVLAGVLVSGEPDGVRKPPRIELRRGAEMASLTNTERQRAGLAPFT